MEQSVVNGVAQSLKSQMVFESSQGLFHHLEEIAEHKKQVCMVCKVDTLG